MQTKYPRRAFMAISIAAATMLSTKAPAFSLSETQIAPDLLRSALAAHRRHAARVLHADRFGVVDFSRVSSVPRLFIVDFASGDMRSHLVAHGRGSDPAHTGWARSFSNEPGSFASSTGAFVTGMEYRGRHGRSLHLHGLDAENCNAERRAIVVHAAPYVSASIASASGMIGRSEGCFALSSASLGTVLDQLGPGRLLYAGLSAG